MLKAEQLPSVDADLANRVIAVAVSIAPCLDLFGENDPRLERALAVLKAVAAHGAGRGSASVRSQRVGSAQVDYGSAQSWFSQDDRDALAALCTLEGGSAGLPVGRFPAPGVVVGAWSEKGVR